MSLLKPRTGLIDVSLQHGLLTGMKASLDAGDERSYPGAGTDRWGDLSGVVSNYFRGATSGAEASDPTANGTAGRRSLGEYFSLDGSDYFRLATANPTWVNNLHKDNAIHSCCAWLYYPSVTLMGIFGSSGSDFNRTGFEFNISAAGLLTATQRNSGGAGTGASQSTAAVVPTGRWSFLGYSIDEANSVLTMQINNTVEAFTFAYISPSAAAASYTIEIGSRGNANSMAPAGTLIAGVIQWEGRALSISERMALYQATRGKFGV